jgi:hypothetical protein
MRIIITSQIMKRIQGRNPRLNAAILLPFLFGGPQGTVTELLFEKRELIPRIQALIISL